MKTKTNKLLAFGIILSMLFVMAVVPASAAQSGTCGDNLTWTLDNSGTLTISGTGDMTNYSSSASVPWYSSCSSIKTIVIQNGVTSIGDGAFSGCESLTSITIPDSVTSVGNMAFSSCYGLTIITIPDGVTSIGNGAFYYCISLTSITIPDSVTSIGNGAFSLCYSLTAIDVNQNNQNYSSENGTLFNKDRTTLIACPTVKTENYIIPDSVTSIVSFAFYDCRLTSITIPDSITSIGYGAFAYCYDLTSITIPDSVTVIGDDAFSYCDSLTDVYYGGTASQWNNISIGYDGNDVLTSATKHYNCIFANKLTDETDYNGETVSLPDGAVLDTGENLNFRNGYVNTGNGYVKAGNKKITGSNVHFTSDGKIRLDAGETAKVEKDNGDGTTDQGFIVGIFNPTGIIRMTLSVSGTANDKNYTGRTITKDFDFTNPEIEGLINFGFEVKRVPNPLELTILSIE